MQQQHDFARGWVTGGFRPGMAGLGLLALVAASSACGLPIVGSPSATDILSRAASSSLREAHVTLTAGLGSGAVAGDGWMAFRPAPALDITLEVVVSGPSPSARREERVVAGRVYVKLDGSRKWRLTTLPGSAGGLIDAVPGHWSSSGASYQGEETLPQGRTWHVRAGASGSPFEAWIRESDGYLLRYSSKSPADPFTMTLDQFNSGPPIDAPAGPDLNSGPITVTGRVGQPAMLNSATVTVVSVQRGVPPQTGVPPPAPGRQYLVLEVRYVASDDNVAYGETNWSIEDASGTSYAVSRAARQPRLGAGTLNMGQAAGGFISFQVPAGAAGLVARTSLVEDRLTVPL